MRSKKIIAVVAIVVLVAGAGFFYMRVKDDAAPAYRKVTAARGDIEVSVLATGVVQPRNRLEIKPPIAGRIEQVLAQEGRVVDKGDVLAWMSSTERAALLDAARARGADELKRWEELYRPTPILAPIRGTVISRNVEPGQTFTGTDAVFVMSDRLTVKTQVDETDVAQVRLKQKARITLDAYPDRVLPGRVDQIAYDAKVVNNVTTYTVDVHPEETPPFMRSGMTTNVTFVIHTKSGVLLVPSEAVKMREGRSSVLLAPGDDGDKPEERAVRIGASDGKNIEVLGGVSEGERLLVTRGASRGPRGSNPLSPFGRR